MPVETWEKSRLAGTDIEELLPQLHTQRASCLHTRRNTKAKMGGRLSVSRNKLFRTHISAPALIVYSA
jgi:hypothetical protein